VLQTYACVSGEHVQHALIYEIVFVSNVKYFVNYKTW